MKHLRIFIVLFVFLFVLPIHAQEFRTFTGSNGKVIEGVLLDFDKDTEIAKIRLKQGNKEQNVKLSLFSSKDQEWIKSGGKDDNHFGNQESTTKPDKAPFDSLRKESEAAFKRFLQTANSNVQIAVAGQLGVVQYLSGNTNEAKKTFADYVQKYDPTKDDSYCHWLLGQDMIEVNCFDDLDANIEKLNRATNNGYAKFYAARLLCDYATAESQKGNGSKATELFDRAKRLGNEMKDGSPHLIPHLAVCQARIGRFEEAIQCERQPKKDMFGR